jgi:hypothetical protein
LGQILVRNVISFDTQCVSDDLGGSVAVVAVDCLLQKIGHVTPHTIFGSLAALGRPSFANKAGQFFHHRLMGKFMKLALTVATLISLGGTAQAQQGIGQRDLTPEEKTVIIDAVAPSLRNPGSAKYHWASFPAVVTAGSVNYCATVDAQSPYAAYNGRQAYIVEAQMSGNRVSSAVIGLIAGGKDFAIVTNMCAKYGLDPRNAS